MKPVFQTKFGEPEGNCLAACIASLLEIGIDEIPNFYFKEDETHWTKRFEAYLKTKGIAPLYFAKDQYGRFLIPPEGVYYLAWGISPRGLDHSVIYHRGELAHDPHPSGGGVNPIDEIVVFLRTFNS